MYQARKKRRSLRPTVGKKNHQALLKVKVRHVPVGLFAPVLIFNTDEEMADEVAQQEEAELEALLSMIETGRTADPPEPYERPETPYGSDDEEYENLFLEVINEESILGNKLSQEENIDKVHQDMMDTS
jgi:hypothetical protein